MAKKAAKKMAPKKAAAKKMAKKVQRVDGFSTGLVIGPKKPSRH